MVNYFREFLKTLKGMRASLFVLAHKPKFGKLKLIGEKMADELTYRLTLHPPGTDVETQVLSVTCGSDGDVETFELSASEDIVEFMVHQDAEVTLSLYYVDDAGNQSQVTTANFVAIDTIAPDAPGSVGTVELVGEVDG